MKIKKMLIKHLSIFELSDFHPKSSVWEAVNIFIAWAIPAIIFVIWSDTYYPKDEFYKEAISEGIGPNLWNVIASLGFFSFGLALIFSSCERISLIVRQILINTYAIGCLTFGLLVGQWFCLPLEQLVWWQYGLFGLTSVLLLVVVFIYNLVVWYLSFLLQRPQGAQTYFLLKANMMHWLFRSALGSFISVVALMTFVWGRL